MRQTLDDADQLVTLLFDRGQDLGCEFPGARAGTLPRITHEVVIPS